MHSNLNSRLDKAMTAEQLTEIIDAILEGKYSWACVLLLRFTGYNPLHYIPYRTYNRLMKEHCQNSSKQRKPKHQVIHLQQINSASNQNKKIRDLEHLSSANYSSDKIQGGLLAYWPSFRKNSWF